MKTGKDLYFIMVNCILSYTKDAKRKMTKQYLFRFFFFSYNCKSYLSIFHLLLYFLIYLYSMITIAYESFDPDLKLQLLNDHGIYRMDEINELSLFVKPQFSVSHLNSRSH